ncbi:MAG: 4Fe-4S dicluster domain-containing protein [Candidatus Micrarchaeota archaeon]
MAQITIDRARCVGCGKCAQVCPAEMFLIKDRKSEVAKPLDQCLECHACEGQCPVKAIKIKGKYN